MSGRDVVRELRESGHLGKPTGGNGLDLVLIIVVVVLLGACGYIGFTRFFGSSPASVQPAVAAVADPDRLWTEVDANGCRAFARAAQVESASLDTGMANRAITEGGFSSLASTLECRLSRKIERFCDPAGKAALVAMVNDYLARLNVVTIGLSVQGAPMSLMGGLFGGEMAAGSDIYDIEKEATLAYLKIYNDRVTKAMRALARAGVVSVDDFSAFMGMGAPPAIAGMLEGVAPTQSVCAA